MDHAEELLRGPRGRRWCLAYATRLDDAVGQALFWLGHAVDPNPGTLLRMHAVDAEPERDPSFTEADVAALIDRVDSASGTREQARDALRDSVDYARYWQEPDGADAVASLPVVQAALLPIAERLAAALPTLTAPAAAAQWTVDWHVAADAAPIERNPSRVLEAWTRELHADEEQAARDRPTDVRANWSGTWWSVPMRLLMTRRTVADALLLFEDSPGWKVATVIPTGGAGRVLEIGSGDDWAALCREYPVEVTASRRHDWYRVTGRDGRWLIPDWERVAESWDAVHLTTLGYLSAATRLIEVDEEYASVMGGWAPDSTIWLADVARETGPRQEWRWAGGESPWEPADAPENTG